MHYFHALFIFDDSFLFYSSAHHIVDCFFLFNDRIDNYYLLFNDCIKNCHLLFNNLNFDRYFEIYNKNEN